MLTSGRFIQLFCRPIDRLQVYLERMLPRIFPLHHVVEGGKKALKTDPDKELDLGEEGILLRPDVPLELATGGREEREGEEDEVAYPSTWESLKGINFWYLSVYLQ